MGRSRTPEQALTITLVRGQSRHRSSTYHVAEFLLQQLELLRPIEVQHVVLPRDTPSFCTGCYACFNEGGEKCPHREQVEPIVDKFLASDVIIVCAPVYAGGVSGQLKVLMDHLSYSELMHKPHPEMFSKTAVQIVLASGKGHRLTARHLRRFLHDLGISRVFTLRRAVAADCWDNVTQKRRVSLEKAMSKIARQVVAGVDKPKVSLGTRFFFGLSRLSIKKWGWNRSDVDYWQGHGWLEKRRPWHTIPTTADTAQSNPRDDDLAPIGAVPDEDRSVSGAPRR